MGYDMSAYRENKPKAGDCSHECSRCTRPPLPQPHYTGRSEFVSHVPECVFTWTDCAGTWTLRRHNPKGSRCTLMIVTKGVCAIPHRPHAHGASGG